MPLLCWPVARMQARMEKPPHRAVTIKDIGDRLGMSHTTVSRALNDHEAISAETKARVEAAAAELGCPASALMGPNRLN